MKQKEKGHIIIKKVTKNPFKIIAGLGILTMSQFMLLIPFANIYFATMKERNGKHSLTDLLDEVKSLLFKEVRYNVRTK